MIPLNDRVLIRRIEEPEQRVGSIIVPDIAKSRAIKGEIMAVGRGKWHPGEWWCIYCGYFLDGGKVEQRPEWRWIEGWLEPPPVHVGQMVYFGSKWNDVGLDYQEPGINWDEKLHMVMMGDIYGIAN